MFYFAPRIEAHSRYNQQNDGGTSPTEAPRACLERGGSQKPHKHVDVQQKLPRIKSAVGFVGLFIVRKVAA
jgi:hypothetical protein